MSWTEIGKRTKTFKSSQLTAWFQKKKHAHKDHRESSTDYYPELTWVLCAFTVYLVLIAAIARDGKNKMA